jgi:hypothetical protein
LTKLNFFSNNDMNIYVSKKKKTFIWLVAEGKIYTKTFWSQKGLLSMELSVNPSYIIDMETTEHLLIHCSFSWRLWTQFMTWWGIIFWCLSKSLDSLLFDWYRMVFINFQKKAWQVLLLFFFLILFEYSSQLTHILIIN